MSEESDRIEQIRSRRRRDAGGVDPQQQQVMQQRVRTRPAAVQKVGATSTDNNKILGVDGNSTWMRDRVTLSLEAQIAMIEMRASYRLTLADMGYHNRQKITSIRPGIYLKTEPTGCYKMSYHNRV